MKRSHAEGQVTRPLLYVAHPVSGDVLGNISRAYRWFRWLRACFPEVTFAMPWVVNLLCGEDDADPAQRERGLVDCETTARACDGVVLVGGRVSAGMKREAGAARVAYDLTRMGEEPPIATLGIAFGEYVDRLAEAA